MTDEGEMRLELVYSRWPELQTLLAGYLNEDWSLDYPNVWAAVDGFRRESPPDLIAAAVTTIGELMTEPDPERALQSACDELGCGYYPPGDGMTYLEWFTRIKDVLEASDPAI
jgi:hypothetical protein